MVLSSNPLRILIIISSLIKMAFLTFMITAAMNKRVVASRRRGRKFPGPGYLPNEWKDRLRKAMLDLQIRRMDRKLRERLEFPGQDAATPSGYFYRKSPAQLMARTG